MACQVQNQYPRFDGSGPSFLGSQQHHELVLKKLSALSVYMESQGKGQADAPRERLSSCPEAGCNDASRDWYAEANSSDGQSGFQTQGHNAPQIVYSQSKPAALPISHPPAFQFSSQPTASPLSSSAPSSNCFPSSPPRQSTDLPRVASFSNGWHEQGKESLAASAARFYEQKRRASMASYRSSQVSNPPPLRSLSVPQDRSSSPLIHGGSPLGRSPVQPSLFSPCESSPDSAFASGGQVGSGSLSRKSPPGSFREGGFFFAPSEKLRAAQLTSSPSPSSSLSSALSAGSGDSNPVSPMGTDSDQSGQSSSMEGASKPLARNWEMEAESVLASGRNRGCAEDKLAPLVGRGLRRGLSRHYGGKSRSFTCLADVVTSPIQDLAKPENPYAKRRKNNNGSHSNLLGRAAYGNFPRDPMLANHLGFEGLEGYRVGNDSEMDDVAVGGAFEWAEEGGDVATALRPLGRLQPLRSQSMADLRAMGRRRSSPDE